MDQYKRDMKQNYGWQQFYTSSVPNDTGVVSPEGYNLLASPEPPYILTAAEAGHDTAPVSYNPAAMLYSTGKQNLVLMASGTNQCDTGCVSAVHKPDPRVFQVKPLYKPTVFKAANGGALPTANNVTGMY
jgi:hypothetical protein